MGGCDGPPPSTESISGGCEAETGVCRGWGGRCSLWTRKDAGPFFPLLFLLLPPILSSSSSLVSSPRPPPSLPRLSPLKENYCNKNIHYPISG